MNGRVTKTRPASLQIPVGYSTKKVVYLPAIPQKYERLISLTATIYFSMSQDCDVSFDHKTNHLENKRKGSFAQGDKYVSECQNKCFVKKAARNLIIMILEKSPYS